MEPDNWQCLSRARKNEIRGAERFFGGDVLELRMHAKREQAAQEALYQKYLQKPNLDDDIPF